MEHPLWFRVVLWATEQLAYLMGWLIPWAALVVLWWLTR